MRNAPEAERWLAGCFGLSTIGGVTAGEFRPVTRTVDGREVVTGVRFEAVEGMARGELRYGNPWNLYSAGPGEVRFPDGSPADPRRNVMYHHTAVKVKFVRIR